MRNLQCAGRDLFKVRGELSCWAKPGFILLPPSSSSVPGNIWHEKREIKESCGFCGEPFLFRKARSRTPDKEQSCLSCLRGVPQCPSRRIQISSLFSAVFPCQQCRQRQGLGTWVHRCAVAWEKLALEEACPWRNLPLEKLALGEACPWRSLPLPCARFPLSKRESLKSGEWGML